jgi:hypothetical protein
LADVFHQPPVSNVASELSLVVNELEQLTRRDPER